VIKKTDIKIRNSKCNFRFRRWSRAKYAMFVSMVICVSVGTLAVSISDKSTEKNQKDISEVYITTETCINEITGEIDFPETNFQEILLAEKKSNDPCSAGPIRFNINRKRLK